MKMKEITANEKAQWIDNLTYGYGEEALKKAFDTVCDPNDWKGPIDCFVTADNVAVVVAAIQFYTATTPKVEAVKDNRTANSTLFRVKSEGYRKGPAGDH